MPETGDHPASTSGDAAAAASIHHANDEAQHQSARVALQLGDRYMLLLGSRNDATQSGEQAMRQIRQEYDLAIANKKPRWLPRSPFRKPALYIGTLSTVRPSTDGGESGAVELREVAFSKLEYSAALTAAFSRPDILRGTASFAEQYPDTIVAGTASSSSSKAVVIAQKIDEPAVFCLVVLALVLAVAVGLGVGIGTSSAQVGLGCFAGISGVFSLLVGILHWATK